MAATETEKISPTDSIAGVSVLFVRDALRKLPQQFTAAWFLEKMQPQQPSVSRHVLAELVRRGWVEDRPREQLRYDITVAGMRLIAVRATKRIARATADRQVATIPERVRAYNADEASIFQIVRVWLMGSYLTDAPDVGDVDVVVETVQRYDPHSPQYRACLRSAPRSDMVRELFWVHAEPLRAVGQRSRTLHVMALSDIADLPWWESAEKRLLWPEGDT